MEISKQVSVSVRTDPYENPGGKDIQRITLQGEQVRIEVTNLGCAVMAIYTPDRQGTLKNIVAGFPDLMDYAQNDHYLGCVIGRYANRIANASFAVNGNTFTLSRNDGPNHLHGGIEGFNRKIWTVSSFITNRDEAGVVFEYLSPEGEEGYPGNLRVKVRYLLNDRNQLCIQYSAKTDKSTPVSLTNHSYFNLTGFETPDILDHLLHINARQYTPKGDINTPTGVIGTTEGTPLSFFTPKPIGRDIMSFPEDGGFDQNYVLEKKNAGDIALAAELTALQSGRTLRIYTDQPALQLYTANLWDGSITGSQGIPYLRYGAVALETQAFPDSPNQPHFPCAILHPGKTYFSQTIYEFGIEPL